MSPGRRSRHRRLPPSRPAAAAAARPAPTIQIVAPTTLGGTRVRLGALVDARRSLTSVDIDYGRTTAYGERTRYAMNVGAETSGPIAVSRELARLQRGVTYHYRLTARSVGGTAIVTGTFATPPTPTISRLRATAAVISLRANTPGLLRIAIQRAASGRRQGFGVISRRVRAAGATTIRWRGRVGRRTLAPGTYRLRATLQTRYARGVTTSAPFTVARR